MVFFGLASLPGLCRTYLLFQVILAVCDQHDLLGLHQCNELLRNMHGCLQRVVGFDIGKYRWRTVVRLLRPAAFLGSLRLLPLWLCTWSPSGLSVYPILPSLQAQKSEDKNLAF